MRTYYTSFCFEKYNPDEIHCTHMYFGELEEQIVTKIKVIISCYFAFTELHKAQLLFDQRDLFGEEKSIPVLLTNDKDLNSYGGLRNRLMEYSSSKYLFNPHIITELSEFYATMDRYSLVEKTKESVEEILIIEAK